MLIRQENQNRTLIAVREGTEAAPRCGTLHVWNIGIDTISVLFGAEGTTSWQNGE